MSESISQPEKAQSRITAEEYRDVETTLHGLQNMFAHMQIEPTTSGDNRATQVDNQTFPLVTTYIENGAMYDTKPAGQDTLTAMMMGATQHPANIESLFAKLVQGGRVMSEVADKLRMDALNRAQARLVESADVMKEHDFKAAANVVEETGQRYEPGDPNARLLYSYAAAIYAQYPECQAVSNSTLELIAAELTQEIEQPDTDNMQRLHDRLDG